MHVGDNRDRGGNLTQVQFYDEGTNLHRLWDSDLIHAVGGNDHIWVERVEQRITPETAKAWSAGTVEDWAGETLRAAKLAYQEREGATGPMPSGTILGSAYLKRADPILREQMAKAGVRLAHDLNTIFAKADAEPNRRARSRTRGAARSR